MDKEKDTISVSAGVQAGQAVYSKLVLSIYDLYVLGLSNSFIWKCPTYKLLDMYDLHVSDNHLDVGVGSGYYLDKCRFSSRKPRVAILDLNQNSLDVASKRIARYLPQVYRRNVLEYIDLGPSGHFDSIGINYLLHCLPGSMNDKSVIFDNLSHHLSDGGVIFGSTLLYDEEKLGVIPKKLMDIYNKKGIFCNKNDTLDALKDNLEKRFSKSYIDVIGCAALFWAKK